MTSSYSNPPTCGLTAALRRAHQPR